MSKSSLKTFVLDTSVLLFDHNSLKSFKHHNIILPITVLEELDKFKVGNDTKNFEARNVIRFLDSLSENNILSEWTSLGSNLGNIKVNFTDKSTQLNADQFNLMSNDNKIIECVLNSSINENKAILVTKDINLRIKARALGIISEDFESGKINDFDSIQRGFETIELESEDSTILSRLYNNRKISGDEILQESKKVANSYYTLKHGTDAILIKYDKDSNSVERVEKKYVSGIRPKNAEQTFAVNSLCDENIKVVALEGVAGTGKTLLALASALEQKNLYHDIVLSRPIVALSNRDIGYLPGEAEDKISPYMQPLWDNLKFIKSQNKPESKRRKIIESMEEDGQIQITALAFIRGRSLSNTMFIVDEAQNLTPHEIKTIITRAGEGTKIVFTGDINQIDTPYLDENSNGLSYLIDRFKGEQLFSHIKLEKGERSELANLANKLL